MKNNYICHAPYLRKSIAYDHDFWYSCVKLCYLQGIFFIFLKFFFGMLGGRSEKSSPKWKLTITSVRCHISGTKKHIIMIFGTLVLNDDTTTSFFHFCEMFFYWAVMGVKGKSIAQIENNNYIQHVSYLRNSITYDHDFWYTCVKWYLQA